jgi:cell division protein FtsI (penicillin-binding protein 3)
MPEKDKYGHWTNWSKTALPWMSIGYETQIPPISTVTFYNAIANDGVMMRPRFVKSVMKDGKVVAEFPPEKVMERRIAKPQTVKTMQTILEHVVSQGLGKKAGSRMFKVAGKTGTAQIAEGGGYKTGVVKYWLSFAGYFPADNPRYSCIVCLKKSGLPASGGGMSGVVFHHIAEGVMARDLKLRVENAHDTTSIVIPDVKNGNISDANYVLNYLGIKTNKEWDGSYINGNPIWGRAERQSSQVALHQVKVNKNVTPDVTGMGAKDAVYLLESLGLKVKLHGRGKVKSQSYTAGKSIIQGSECILNLE